MFRVALSLALVLLTNVTATAVKPTYQAVLNGETYEGTPLLSSSSNVLLLSRDGSYVHFKTADADRYRKLPRPFKSYSQSELRGQLMREFGKGFDVSGTGSYLVVHPAGKRDLWAPRFEKLYRAFQLYFGSRGIRLKRLQFPLVAVVFQTKQEFLHYAKEQGAKIGPNTLGYYSPNTNRITLYDVTADRPNVSWHHNADTIIHETAHQVAFNTGLHTRGGANPRWVVEGLGTMFEPRGVWNSRSYPRVEDRINQGRLDHFKAYLKRREKGQLAEFVSSDRAFSKNTLDGYAEAWALTFFLVEKKPQQYMKYLQTTAARPAFREYRQQDRLADFTRAFGTNLSVLESHYLRFIQGL